MKALILFLTVIGGFVLNAEAKIKKYNYVITETSVPTSLDPLDADQTQNLAVARMIYSTPIEIDSQDRLSSQILESFNYDPKLNLVAWVAKNGTKYSDGSTLTPQDIAFAVARMAYTRPKFPILEHIKGLEEWIKSAEPLKTFPKGIQVSGNKIEIHFSNKVKNPLFRFCLELFAVIPQKCVDSKTNKVTCDSIPGSGRYVVTSKDDIEIRFQEKSTKDEITFKYISVDKVAQQIVNLDEDTILAGNEVMYSLDELSLLKDSGKVLFLPAARFGILQINPNAVPFGDKLCRILFAEIFRKNYKEVVKERGISESSIFTGIISGYMNPKELRTHSLSKVTPAIENKCLEKIRSSPISWGYVETEKNSAFVQALTASLKFVGQGSIKPQLFKNRKEIAEAFVEGKISFLGSGSGFWAHDPSGDLQMLFTPNLHKPLNFVTQDEKLQRLIRDVVNNPDNESYYKAVNQYLHDEGLINIYSHVRRFYFSKNKEFLKRSPLGYSAPTPWQVFEL